MPASSQTIKLHTKQQATDNKEIINRSMPAPDPQATASTKTVGNKQTSERKRRQRETPNYVFGGSLGLSGARSLRGGM